MDQEDPISQFFPGEEGVNLYAVLQLDQDASSDDIKKAYRRLALKYHPDKHANATEDAKADMSLKFQQVGFAYSIVSDDKKRKRYDRTGKTADVFDFAEGEDGWEAYFADLFDRVTKGKLDEMKKEYQSSTEETEDLKSAYLDTKGSIGEIMNLIPHSTHDDEARFIVILSSLISKRELPNLPMWESSIEDEKARLARKKVGEKEASEAETLAKELGVWDEFYGSGKAGERKGKGKANGKMKKQDASDAEVEEDYSGLQALMLKRKEKIADSFFDNLAAKYVEPEKKPKGRGRKRERAVDDEDQSPKKRRSVVLPPEIDDEEFAKLQEKMFGNKPKSSKSEQRTRRSGRSKAT
ncbi:hypothetical protein M378DRAFT_700434 [Amanita muscaria Koide BX008]|uniref:J domain-containing protein n=1 Tax=Amanita muscaria (strain Koide BX008) TaxID=946122 RepID=A0A0C2XJR0_AMAMK|nr:hypothetical protein M378DRAFT_700434 [Amanita muscaria Koide BX008]